MSEIRLLDLAEAPEEGQGKRVEFNHPYTEIPYALGVYFAKGRYLAITDQCKKCESSLAQGKVNGMYALCAREQHAWHIKTGLFKFDRTQSIPTYRVTVKDEGLYIEI
jgi:nitrite reductase/ring-hydroxylating ferredoxin subunit